MNHDIISQTATTLALIDGAIFATLWFNQRADQVGFRTQRTMSNCDI